MPATSPPRTPVEQPADVDRELLGLGTGQQRAVVQGVQEAPLPDPALLLDQRALHDRDLAGRAAEGLQRDREPGARGLVQWNALDSCAQGLFALFRPFGRRRHTSVLPHRPRRLPATPATRRGRSTLLRRCGTWALHDVEGNPVRTRLGLTVPASSHRWRCDPVGCWAGRWPAGHELAAIAPPVSEVGEQGGSLRTPYGRMPVTTPERLSRARGCHCQTAMASTKHDQRHPRCRVIKPAQGPERALTTGPHGALQHRSTVRSTNA